MVILRPGWCAGVNLQWAVACPGEGRGAVARPDCATAISATPPKPMFSEEFDKISQ